MCFYLILRSLLLFNDKNFPRSHAQLSIVAGKQEAGNGKLP
jgi:hypothetical protein